MEDPKSKHTAIHIILLVLILLAIANAIDPHLFWKHFVIKNYPLHSTMEAMGALAAIIMGFMSIRYLIDVRDSRYEIISLSFLAMGSWDLFHAFLNEGSGFVFSHNISLFLGGFFFVLVIFNWSGKLTVNRKWWKLGMITLFLLLGALTALRTDYLPAMVIESEAPHIMEQSSHFTPLSNYMNILAGIFFLSGSIKIFLDYRKSNKLGLLLLVMLGVQSASAGFLFPYSHTWADSWWFWHVLRLLAFMGIMAFMINQFSRILNERTRTLRAMEESESKFTRLFDSEPDALFISEAETGIITDVNKAAEKLTKKRAEELIGKNQMELHPEDKREEITALFKKITREGSEKPQQVVIQNANGKIIPVELVGNTIRIKRRNLTVSIFRNISERIKLEKDKLNLDRKYKLIIEKVPFPLCILDQNNGNFLFFNQSFLKTFGYTREDLSNVEDWWIRAYPEEEYRKWVIDNWDQSVENAVQNNSDITTETYNVTCANGEVRSIIIGGIVIENELLATFIDITELSQAEEIMKKQQEQLISMFNGMDDLIYVSDPETYELLFVNDSIRKLFGEIKPGIKCYKALQNRESPCPFCTNDIILKKQTGDAYIWEFQNEITRNWYRCFDKAILWSNGKLVRFELAIDITEMKQNQQAIIEEKDFFKATIDSLPGIFYQISPEGKFFRWNPRFAEVVERSEKEIKEMTALDLFAGKDKENIAQAMGEVFQKGYSEVEAELISKSGKKTPFIFNGRLFEDRSTSWLIGMGMDISGLKKVEKSLRRSNKELESFNRIAVGREKRMIELKKMINELSTELNREKPYDLSFMEETDENEEI